MMRINVEKSINTERVVYKTTAESVFQYIFLYFLACIIPVGTIYLIFFPFQNGHHSFGFDFNGITFVFVLYDVFVLISLYLMNKMIVFEGKTFEENRSAVMAVLQERYPEILFSSATPNVVRGQKQVGYLRDRVITVIMTEGKVFVNILNTFRGNGFHFITVGSIIPGVKH